MTLSTHVLDSVTGLPAAGIAVRLAYETQGGWQDVAEASTDADGRVAEIGLRSPGAHRLTFGTGGYFRARGVATFYPEVSVVFDVADPEQPHHVPLLLSPFAYTTYRGS